VTGDPVWPIEERRVPPSDVPGEQAWPTQPFPTRPPAFSPQGVTLEDAFDLTPALKAAAQDELKKRRIGPLYTPPSIDGTFMSPGIIGGANWGGGAFDAATGILYVKTSHQPGFARVVEPDRSPQNPRAGEVDAAYVGNVGGSTSFTPPAPADAAPATRMPALPLLKPPYGEVVAIDLNKGDIAWRVPVGDTPSIRTHPLLAGVPLPEQLGAPGAPGAIVTAGGLIFVGGGDTAIHALDKSNGKTLWRFDLGRRTTATPMTYRTRSGRQFVVIATGRGRQATLVAFAK
jgi:quinoprotein glucose dehydrogenase